MCIRDSFRGVRLFVRLAAFLHDISKTAAARFIKRDVEMFHHESWKLIYFGVKVELQENSASVGCCTLVSAGFFYF